MRPWRRGGFRQAWKRRLPRNLRSLAKGRRSRGIGMRESQCQRREEDRGKVLAGDILTCATGACPSGAYLR
jgi:hypothetical protein